MRLHSSQHHKTSLKLSKTGFMIPVAAFMGLGAIGAAALMQDTDYDASALTETVSTNLSLADYYISITADSSVNMDLAATSAGSYAYATSNVVAKTNVSTGYELYLTAGTSGNTLVHSAGSGTGVISAASGTGGASGTPAVLSSNSYGYAVPRGIIGNSGFDTSYTDPTASSKWAKVPTGETGDKIRTGSMTGESSAAGETTDVHFAVYANNAMAAGTYSGQVVYTMVADMPSVGLSITPNTWTTGTSAPSVTVVSGPMVASGASIDNSDVSITIGGSACTVTDTSTNGGYLTTTCTAPTSLTGTKQSEGGTAYNVVISVSKYNYSATITNGYTVYAPDKNYLQDLTPTACSALTTYDSSNAAATTYTYTDKRDNQDYRIRRLKMGTSGNTACWMVDNLKLTKTTIEAAGNSAKLDTNTSNVASNSAFSLTASDSNTWCTDDNATCDDKSMVIDTSYGTLYNWFAATAGTGTYSTSSGTATASICPGKGTTSSSTWHLPTGNTNNEWYQLFQAYQSDYGWSTINGTSSAGTMTNTWSTTIGPDFIYSGYRNGASTNGQSSTGYGYWWSSTAGNNYLAYNAYLNYNNRFVYGGTNYSSKYRGYAVRCVLTASAS